MGASRQLESLLRALDPPVSSDGSRFLRAFTSTSSGTTRMNPHQHASGQRVWLEVVEAAREDERRLEQIVSTLWGTCRHPGKYPPVPVFNELLRLSMLVEDYRLGMELVRPLRSSNHLHERRRSDPGPLRRCTS